jgi:hypothetical protein
MQRVCTLQCIWQPIASAVKHLFSKCCAAGSGAKVPIQNRHQQTIMVAGWHDLIGQWLIQLSVARQDPVLCPDTFKFRI